jgi:hypothetical protein
MLLDTSGLLCLHHQAEPFHDEACRVTGITPRFSLPNHRIRI